MGLTGDDVLLRAQEVADADLFHMWVLLFELVGEGKCDHGETSVVISGSLTLLARSDLSFNVFGLTFGSMDVAGYRSASRNSK
jgi:hypothetical protein